MNIRTLEVSLLFILAVQLFRVEQITSQIIILIAAFLLVIFSFVSILGTGRGKLDTIRLWCLVFLVLLVQGFLLTRAVITRNLEGSKSLHDGVIMTEASYRALISGRNPYSENLSDLLEREKYTHVSLRPTIHYPYSPLMFLTSVPVFWVTDSLFGVVDMRVTLFVFFLLAALVGASVVKEKILFLILFSFNPLFVPMLFYGANEVIILFLFVLLIYFLNKKREALATVTLGLATATKLLFLPAVPLYFIYVFLTNSRSMKVVLKHLQIFLLVSLFIYLPFLIWNGSDTINALISPWIGASEELYPIAGYIGIPQLLTSIGLVFQTSTFPFLIFVLPFEALLLIFSFKVLKKSLNLSILGVLFAFNILLVLAFSRLVQIYYLAFISQIILLASFLPAEKKNTTGL